MKGGFRSPMAAFLGNVLAFAGRLEGPQLLARAQAPQITPPSVSAPKRHRGAIGPSTVVLARHTGRYQIHRKRLRDGTVRETHVELARGMDRATLKALESARYRRAGGRKGR